MRLDPAIYHDLLLSLLPELVLTGWSLVVLLFVAWRHSTVRDLRITGWLTLLALVSTAVATWWLWWNSATVGGQVSMIAADDFRWVATWVFLGAAALTVLISFAYLEREQLLAPEYYVLLIFGTLGMMVMAAGADLMVIFLGLELMSVAVYVLAGIDRRRARAAEAALKYFLLGAFASGFLLYGIALVYGATGTTNLGLIGGQVSLMGQPSVMLLAGLALLIVGFAFKIAAVPFHMWAPDVYDGAPTPVTAFMATGVKAAAFAALLRVMNQAFGPVPAWHEILWWLAVITMIGGNLFALGQRSLKRMLAYSSVAHAGYLLVAVSAGGATGSSAFLVYVIAYTLMSLGAFAVLTAKGRGGESDVLIDDLSGLAARRPWLAFALAICIHSGAHERRLGGLLSSGHYGDVHETGAERDCPRGCLSRPLGTVRRHRGRRWAAALRSLAQSPLRSRQICRRDRAAHGHDHRHPTLKGGLGGHCPSGQRVPSAPVRV